MNRTPVDSSNIAAVGYEDTTMILEVLFHNGTIYQYFDVPRTVYEELMSADSKGTFLNTNVKNNYRYTKL